VADAIAKTIGKVGIAESTSMELQLAEMDNEIKRADPKESISCEHYAVPEGSPAKDIHFVLESGYSVKKKSGDIKVSSLPWMYQCSIESAIATEAQVTLWYDGYNRVIDDVFGRRLRTRHHSFDPKTETGQWWMQHSSNGTLHCPHSDVTKADFVRIDLLHRFGGVYVDLDMIVLSNAILAVQDGFAAQQYGGAHSLTNSFAKLRKGHRFAECWLATWRKHWKMYVADLEECQESEGRDCSNRPDWGFMGPATVTDAYLSCPDDVAIFPPAAFGHDRPCSFDFFDSAPKEDIAELTSICAGHSSNLEKLLPNKDPMFVGRIAHHSCNMGTTRLNKLAADSNGLDHSSFIGKAMKQRCPKTMARMT
jgi:hypothetical protein